MEGAECYLFGAFDGCLALCPCGGNYAMFHLRGSLVGEGERQDFFSREPCLRFQKVADSFGNDARFSGTRSGHHDERTVAMMCRGKLLRVKYNSRGRRGGVIE